MIYYDFANHLNSCINVVLRLFVALIIDKISTGTSSYINITILIKKKEKVRLIA